MKNDALAVKVLRWADVSLRFPPRGPFSCPLSQALALIFFWPSGSLGPFTDTHLTLWSTGVESTSFWHLKLTALLN